MSIKNTNDPQEKSSFLQHVSWILKAFHVFLPGFIFLLIGYFAFVHLTQGKDIIQQSAEHNQTWIGGIYVMLSIFFWAFTTWYTARLLGYGLQDMYANAEWCVSYLPRLYGYGVFLVISLALYYKSYVQPGWKENLYGGAIALGDIFIFLFMNPYLENRLLPQKTVMTYDLTIKPGLENTLRFWRWVAVILSSICAVVFIWFWGSMNEIVLIPSLLVMQVCFLYLLIVRFPLYKATDQGKKEVKDKNLESRISFLNPFVHCVFKKTIDQFDFKFEENYFIIWCLLALFGLVCYLLSINSLEFARALRPFPIAMIAFGVILGFINFISVLSRRNKINFGFLIFLIIIIGSLIFDTHRARILPSGSHKRQSFKEYLDQWLSWHKEKIKKYPKARYPIIFILADGGASRSGFWAASVLSRFDSATRLDSVDYTSIFTEHLFCLSGASGGSVGNATFVAAIKLENANHKLHSQSLCNNFLKNDFLSYPLTHLLGPDLIQPVFKYIPSWHDRAAALEESMEEVPDSENQQMTEIMKNGFCALLPDNNCRLPMLVINSTRMTDCGPAAVSNIDFSRSFMGSDTNKKVFGKRIDILSLLKDTEDLRYSTSMVMGARFPYISPAGKVGNSDYFVDGGYFDNSGAGVVQEMILEMERLKKDSTNIAESAVRNLLNKLDFYVIHLSNSPPVEKKGRDWVNPLINDLFAPILAISGSFTSQTAVNDSRLINYLASQYGSNHYVEFNLYDDKLKDPIPMDWVISSPALQQMDSSLNRRVGVIMVAERLKKPGKETTLFEDLPELK